MSSFDVRFWDVRKLEGKRRPYQVRWVVAGREKSRTFLTKALADGFRSRLVTKARKGVAFDETSGLPVDEAQKLNERTWYVHACAYAEMKWPHAAATSRRSMAEALTTLTIALTTNVRGRPDDDVLRRALFGWAFTPTGRDGQAPPEFAEALDWLEQASLPMSAVAEPDTVRKALHAVSTTLTGRPAAATTARRKRAVFFNALRYAVERGDLTENPLTRVQWSAPEVAQTVDRRVVANPDQVRALLRAVRDQGATGRHLVAFYGCMYFAGMRPSEVVALRRSSCLLPESGWGRLDLDGSEPRAGVRWTDDGAARDARQLKHRAVKTVRPVPIPPELVALLRSHITTHGVTEDGRLFRTGSGGPLQNHTIAKVWRTARVSGLSAEQASSPLARRPYDLRHAAATLWLNSGVPATEVARRLGHGVAVLLKVYANCLDGQEVIANGSIEQALGTPGAEAAILDLDHPAGDGTDGHAEQARNDPTDDRGQPG
ncbi:tyrosine-type recombinase/integrase [Parafrankia discariae]|uniref:tyrosine-type recombinase/integrase n=1 Tax=Parafrankia discariae TaxID=365528 RepID=UPI000368C98F|nr:tyrosine-type recombinase/integrase [Parafrankia discariae]